MDSNGNSDLPNLNALSSNAFTLQKQKLKALSNPMGYGMDMDKDIPPKSFYVWNCTCALAQHMIVIKPSLKLNHHQVFVETVGLVGNEME